MYSENENTLGINGVIKKKTTKKEEPKTVDITDEVKIVDHNEEESKAEKIEVKEKPETRQTIKAKE